RRDQARRIRHLPHRPEDRRRARLRRETMPKRDTPLGAYNFLVEFDGNEASNSALGGFSDLSGLGAEITLMEYRQGNDRENRVRKIPALSKSSDLTLKRGIMGLTNFWQWVSV